MPPYAEDDRRQGCLERLPAHLLQPPAHQEATRRSLQPHYRRHPAGTHLLQLPAHQEAARHSLQPHRRRHLAGTHLLQPLAH